jgi:signal peptidase II
MIDRLLRLPAVLFLLVLVTDQLTKMIALNLLTPSVPVPFLGDAVRWTLVYNPGGAFSTRLAGSLFYLIFSLIVLVFLVYYIIRQRHVRFMVLPLSIVAGGATGNIIDRLRFGQVVDFIDCNIPDITIGSYHLDRWPIFNVADSAISCGIIVTIIFIYYYAHKAKILAQQNPDTPQTKTS